MEVHGTWNTKDGIHTLLCYELSAKSLIGLMSVHSLNTDVFAERVRNKSKIWDPAGIRTQDLLNTSQTPLPFSHLDPW